MGHSWTGRPGGSLSGRWLRYDVRKIPGNSGKSLKSRKSRALSEAIARFPAHSERRRSPRPRHLLSFPELAFPELAFPAQRFPELAFPVQRFPELAFPEGVRYLVSGHYRRQIIRLP